MGDSDLRVFDAYGVGDIVVEPEALDFLIRQREEERVREELDRTTTTRFGAAAAVAAKTSRFAVAPTFFSNGGGGGGGGGAASRFGGARLVGDGTQGGAAPTSANAASGLFGVASAANRSVVAAPAAKKSRFAL